MTTDNGSGAEMEKEMKENALGIEAKQDAAQKKLEQDNAEKEALKLNCDHIAKFVEELSKCNLETMSEEGKQVLIDSQKQVQVLLEIQDNLIKSTNKNEEKKPIEINDRNRMKEAEATPTAVKPKIPTKKTPSYFGSSEDDAEVQSSDLEERVKALRSSKPSSTHTHKKKTHRRKTESYKGNPNDVSVLEIIAERLDNRRVPILGKYDEESGESLENYLSRFENYCEDNIKGGKSFWIDELESRLTGDTLEIFKSMKDPNETYERLRVKLVEWYRGMKDMRKRKARVQFESAEHNPNESLYIYSTRLEKMFRRAYPSACHPQLLEGSSVLRDKFIDTIPSDTRKKLREQLFQNHLHCSPKLQPK